MVRKPLFQYLNILWRGLLSSEMYKIIGVCGFHTVESQWREGGMVRKPREHNASLPLAPPSQSLSVSHLCTVQCAVRYTSH